eukprot:CAMPEP_0172586226 /NCGR_PEP_ID=MMETSP1068-20121228/5602_1 /TAXON_ID=35684 /ORGANISM="Pseudopedinella elastica, Strain CCMP716" /LENGTH=246 /DNA_ID=CAMNT_0013380957 /DNA_START=140 /DNA_END=881 /DNA_ORIENTATION=+
MEASEGRWCQVRRIRQPAEPPTSAAAARLALDRDDENKNWGLENEATGKILPSLPVEGEDRPAGGGVKAAEATEAVVESTAALPGYIEHVVMPEDTFQGLCLRYKLKPLALRKANGFSGENIRVLKVLRIPTAHLCSSGTGVAFVPQVRNRDVTTQLFRNETGLGSIEAKLYLEDHGWDVAKAKRAWEEDNAWEEEAAREQAALATGKESKSAPVSAEKSTSKLGARAKVGRWSLKGDAGKETAVL